MKKLRTAIVPGLVLLALGAVLVGQAPATARQLVDDDLAYAADGSGVVACNGGTQIASMVRLNDSPVSTGETVNPVQVPGAVVPFVVPAGNSAQVLVTFDAEARLTGQPNTFATPVDFLQVQILLDGAPMPPDNDLMFTTDVGQSTATQACKRVGQGNHVVTVVWQVIDQAAGSVLTGTLDDYQLTVQLSA
ncbi:MULTISPECIES: hypothetical protein [unclassified Solwaraspora]|uniref:hypothetical protein n=1 Tax=unclassified Solwaraspora TaxID=2627926 RepID=UPI00259B70EA|nr:hypothetical protein [Solwaraspora sp. WMMA2056]WJK41730.1 hypothetical protein O7608_04720 [Solwaraspora sp. WMMA2056]